MARPVTGAVQAATIRRRIRIPLRFADDYATTATVVSFTGLTDAQQHVALELGRPAAAGLGAATGVTIATLYAVLMLTAVAPGAGLLLGDAVRRRRDQGQSGESRRPDPAPRALEVVRD